VKERLEQQIKQIKFDFDEYKKASGKEIQRMRKDIDDMDRAKEQEGNELKQM
jgi:hypothetical protein